MVDIKTYSRPEFNHICESKEFMDNIVWEKSCIIGILSSNDKKENHPLFRFQKLHNVLLLVFDDIDINSINKIFYPDAGFTTPFDDKLASMLKQFIEAHLSIKKYFIHCDVGISRSVAVGYCVAKTYDLHHNHPMFLSECSLFKFFLTQKSFVPNNLIIKKYEEVFDELSPLKNNGVPALKNLYQFYFQGLND